MNVVFWNVEGAFKLFDYGIQRYLCKFDMIFLVETWTDSQSPQPNLNDMFLVTLLNATKKGASKGRKSAGIALYAKNGIKVSLVKTVCTCPNTIAVKNGNTIYVAVYRPPVGSKYFLEDFFDSLGNLINEVSALKSVETTIVLGDFNARTADGIDGFECEKNCGMGLIIEPSKERRSRDKVINKDGENMLDFCRQTGLRIVNGRSESDPQGDITFLSPQGQSLIDYCLIDSDSFDRVLDFKIGNSVRSHHFPLELQLVAEQKPSKPKSEKEEYKITSYPIKEERIEKVLELMESKIKDFWDQIVEKSEINVEETAMLTKHWILRVLRPFRTKKTFPAKRREGSIYLPSEMLENEAKEKLEEYRENPTKRNQETYLELRSKHRKQMMKEKQEEKTKNGLVTKELLETNDWGTLWKKVKSYTSPRCKESPEINPQDWVQYFDDLLNVQCDIRNENWDNLSDAADTIPELDDAIALGEVERAIKQCNNKSAPGLDGISYAVIKKFQIHLGPLLTLLYNQVLSCGKTPSEWSHAVIIPLFKNKGPRNNCANYRGISLLPCLGKLFTRVMDNRFVEWSKRHEFLPDSQAGFRSGYSTIDQCFILNSIIEKRMRSGATTYAAFIDLEKAFDSIPRRALWFKLAKLGISKKYLNLCMSSYASSKFSIRGAGQRYANAIPTTTGVMQGAINSPSLFLHFLQDLSNVLDKVEGSSAPGLGKESVSNLAFADDLCLLSTTPIGLQRLLTELKKYCDEWGLKVNVTKTNIVVFKRGTKLKEIEKWEFDGRVIEVKTSFKYLGINFAFNGKWNFHMRDKGVRGRFMANRIKSFLRSQEEVPLKLQSHLFDSVVGAILLYGSEIFAWSPIMREFEKIERSFHKNCLGLPQSSCGVAIDLCLGLIGLRSKAKIRALCYWHKLAIATKRNLVHRALDLQKVMARNDRECWALKVKNELSRIGLGFIWESPEKLTARRFKALCSIRIGDMSLQEKTEELAKFSSCKFLRTMETSKKALPFISSSTSKFRRRIYLKIVIGQLENLFKREEDSKICVDCKVEIHEHVLIHRVLFCVSLNDLRSKVSPDVVSKFTQMKRNTTRFLKLFLDKLVIKGGHKLAKLMSIEEGTSESGQ